MSNLKKLSLITDNLSEKKPKEIEDGSDSSKIEVISDHKSKKTPSPIIKLSLKL